MAHFEIDPTAKPYVPGAPSRFWDRLAMACNWAGLLAIFALLYGLPIAFIVWLL